MWESTKALREALNKLEESLGKDRTRPLQMRPQDAFAQATARMLATRSGHVPVHRVRGLRRRAVQQ